MSSLLQNVLASRLAQATIGGEQNHNNNSGTGSSSSSSTSPPCAMGPPAAPASASAASSSSSSANANANVQGLEDWETLDEASTFSDEEMIGVMSAPGTVPGTPHISRPSSPGISVKSRRSHLSHSIESSGSSVVSRKGKTDPLRRYRRSATLNYCWYRQCHSSSIDATFSPMTASGGAKWTRRESKIDWKSQYAKQKRMEAREAQRLESLPGSGTATPSRTQRLRDEGIKTPREIREEEWSNQESVGYSKGEMREWYKSQGGTKGGKIKGKTGKGGVKTGLANDGGLWE